MTNPFDGTWVLDRDTLESLLDMADVNRAVEEAFLAYGNGKWQAPPKIIFSQEQYDGDFGAMPAYCLEPEFIAIKWGGVHNRNPEMGLPTTLTQIILSDPATAWPLAIMEGALITGMRTGAAAGIATKYMARQDARVLAIVGAGVVGRRSAESICLVRDVSRVVVASRTLDEARKYAQEMTPRLGVDVTPVETIKEAVEQADIVSIATPARSPQIMAAWIRPGTHVNTMGADSPGKQEVDPELLKKSRIIVDHKDQAKVLGEIHRPLAQGLLSPEAVAGDIGELVAGKIQGRLDESQITVFDGTGMALEDAAVAHMAHHKARQQNLGQKIALNRPPRG